MEIVYLFKNIDCANCANELEGKFNKLKGVNSCTINFLSQKVILDVDNEKSLDSVLLTAKNFEDGVSLTRIK